MQFRRDLAAHGGADAIAADQDVGILDATAVEMNAHAAAVLLDALERPAEVIVRRVDGGAEQPLQAVPRGKDLRQQPLVGDAAMAVDIKSYLPYDLLTKVDIASMANGLEARSPFLDHVVMEFAAQLPAQLKLRGTDSKHLLKTTFADLLPVESVRRRKMGFGVPIAKWLRTSSRELLQDTLLSKWARERGYFKSDRVEYLIREHLAERADYSFQLWNLLMLELWQQELVDASAPAVKYIQIDSPASAL